jgi:hypothetical protein
MAATPIPYVTPCAVRVMALPESLGSCITWGDSQCRIATAVVKALLLEPKNRARRRQNQYILLASEIDEIEPLVDVQQEKGSMAPDLRWTLSLELPLVARRSARTLQNALTFDSNEITPGTKAKDHSKGKRHGRAIRSILTAGLIVLIMHGRVEDGAEGYTPEAVIALIGEEGVTNTMFMRSEKEVKAAWRKYRSVAHLAAALLHYIAKQEYSRFRAEEQERWRSDIVDFLQDAEFFQGFLTKTLPSLKPKLLRTNFDLFRLPSWLGVTPSQPPPLKDVAKYVRRGGTAQLRKKAA